MAEQRRVTDGRRFAALTAILLEHETGYRQTPGGPYRRAVSGVSAWRHQPGWRPPSRPDGMAYDDDPNDTGGRTCMGLLQREYDPWRRSRGMRARDVWLIEDAEVDALYEAQYWRPSQAGDMPPGVDLVVYDSALLCGVGMSARFLQRALGVRDDGHIGEATREALAAADPATVVRGMIEARRTYHRRSRTFRHHGHGWLKRADALERSALSLVRVPLPTGQPARATGRSFSDPSDAHTASGRSLFGPSDAHTASGPIPVVEWGEAVVHEIAHSVDGASGADHAPAHEFALASRRDRPPPPPASVTETNTAMRSVATGAIGTGFGVTQALDVADRVERLGIVRGLLDRPLSLALIAGAVALVLLANADIRDRARKLILGV